MHLGIVPVRTAEGHDELATRARRLSQRHRHRAVLLCVDGRRSAGEIGALARRAGVQESAYRELIGLGLIAEPASTNGADAAPRHSEPILPSRHPEPPLAAAVPSVIRPIEASRRSAKAAVRAALVPLSAGMPSAALNPASLRLRPESRRCDGIDIGGAAPSAMRADPAAGSQVSQEQLERP